MSKDVLFEIGIEELPARFIDDAEKQLDEKTSKWLQDVNIAFENIKTYATPRRLAVLISGIADEQKIMKEEVRGPQMKIAKDENDEWSKAALGFVKGQGKDVADIYTKEVKGQTYIFVEKMTEGKATKEILPQFKDIIGDIQFQQTMRWGEDTYRFARPIRWLVALYNDEVIPFEVAHVVTSNITRGHRFLGKETAIDLPSSYEEILEENYVIVDPKKREQLIVDQIKEIEEKEGFTIQVNESLLNEVRNLVEYPTAFFGSFSEDYLRIPEEVLVTSMAEHQRYFPVRDSETDTLLPYFVSVRNGDDRALNNVVRGNEKVLRARLADGAFFYDEDREKSIAFFNDKLKTVVFQEKIGTTYEKVRNVQEITRHLAEQLELSEEMTKQAVRAAEISKFDLVTDMVNEFPELQGIMGEKYALHFGEDAAVAQAVREHYLPVSANGDLPTTTIGSVVSIADKLDTIIGCISVGLVPTSSQDPLGLRRQAIGVLRILLAEKWDLSIEQLVEEVCKNYNVTVEEVRTEIKQFFTNRAAYILNEKAIEQDVIQAVLANGVGVLHDKLNKAALLSEKRNDPAFKEIEESFTRVMNLGKKHIEKNIDTALFETDSEKALYDNYKEVKDTFESYVKTKDASQQLATLASLTEPIKTFFEHNMVMADDEKVKANRLALVHAISALIEQFADVTLIEWKQHQ